MNNNLSFEMKISNINVLKFSQFDIQEFDNKNEKIIEYQSNFQLEVFEQTEEVGIMSTVKIKIIELDDYFGELKVLIKFKMIPFNKVVLKEDDKFKIPDAVLLQLVGIVTGTIRGILYEKYKGTRLQDQIFPLIDINKLIKDNKK